MSRQAAMNKLIALIYTVNDVRRRPPAYVNMWSLPKISDYMKEDGIPQGYIDNMIAFYRELRR